MSKKCLIIECQNNHNFICILLIFMTWKLCCASSFNGTTSAQIVISNPATHSEVNSAIIPTPLFTIQTKYPLSITNPKSLDPNRDAGSLHITPTAGQQFDITSSSSGTSIDNEEKENISSSFSYVNKANKVNSNIVSSAQWISSAAHKDSETSVIWDKVESPKASPANFFKSSISNLLPYEKISIDASVIITSPIPNPTGEEISQRSIQLTPSMRSSRQDVGIKTIKDNEVSNHIMSNETRETNSSASIVPNYKNLTSLSNSVNATKHYVIEPSKDKHFLTVIIAVIGSLCALSIGLIAAYYRWRLAGRRRKVYFSHHGEQPKDFAEDTGVRSPVLMPDEIEMQVGRSTSLRVRRAVVLATDPSEMDLGPNVVNSSQTTQSSGDTQAITSATPPPPPYRTPPPYLPDMIIENIHAL